MKTVFLIVVGLIWTAVTLGGDFFAVNAIRQQLRAEHFPTVTGVITQNDIEITRSSKGGSNYTARLRFSYAVDGRAYVGDRHRYGSYAASAQHAEALASRYPVGAPVIVHFNPDDPADAILSPGIDGADVFVPFFLLPFNLILFGAVAWLARGKRPFDDPSAPISPLSAGISAFFVGWFVIVFTVAFASGFDPSLPVAIGAWGALTAITFGAAAYAVTQRTAR
ncbi:MAG: hypothetical protein DCF16_12335 [Alphaproteobacteria bacterium]|nr:MAG: hypothetical protein DCF16_12335 [Alphaproteobacteria bacterium]